MGSLPPGPIGKLQKEEADRWETARFRRKKVVLYILKSTFFFFFFFASYAILGKTFHIYRAVFFSVDWRLGGEVP